MEYHGKGIVDGHFQKIHSFLDLAADSMALESIYDIIDAVQYMNKQHNNRIIETNKKVKKLENKKVKTDLKVYEYVPESWIFENRNILPIKDITRCYCLRASAVTNQLYRFSRSNSANGQVIPFTPQVKVIKTDMNEAPERKEEVTVNFKHLERTISIHKGFEKNETVVPSDFEYLLTKY